MTGEFDVDVGVSSELIAAAIIGCMVVLPGSIAFIMYIFRRLKHRKQMNGNNSNISNVSNDYDTVIHIIERTQHFMGNSRSTCILELM